MFAILCIIDICVSQSINSTIVFHKDGGELKGNALFLTHCNEEIEFLRKGEDSSGFCMGRRGGHRHLFYAAIVCHYPIEVNVLGHTTPFLLTKILYKLN